MLYSLCSLCVQRQLLCNVLHLIDRSACVGICSCVLLFALLSWRWTRYPMAPSSAPLAPLSRVLLVSPVSSTDWRLTLKLSFWSALLLSAVLQCFDRLWIEFGQGFGALSVCAGDSWHFCPFRELVSEGTRLRRRRLQCFDDMARWLTRKCSYQLQQWASDSAPNVSLLAS